jgi:hypothetical protein
MTADLTFNTIVFKKAWDNQTGSERRSTTRGINTPDLLLVKHQDAVQPQNKLPMKRHLVRVERHNTDAADAVAYVTSFYVVAEVSERATSTDVSTALATFKAAVADADLLAAVLNSES